MLTSQLTALLQQAFQKAGYDSAYGEVVVSARPDLCQFQCNGAMPAAKEYKKAPFMISDAVIEALDTIPEASDMIEKAVTVKPGFININIKDSALAKYMDTLSHDSHCGVTQAESPETFVIDYGGPNIAKPLHVGHLRTAIIGESIKRILRYMGHHVIGDIHLGDWGLQMGMIIYDIRRQQPDLVYFDDSFDGPYPSNAPFTLDDLEEIYPRVSKESKIDSEVYEGAKKATYDLQHGHPGYIALWEHIVNISLVAIKENYRRLNVDFDLWYGESTAHPFIEPTLDILKDKGTLYESDGAFVVDVSREDDKKEIPPLILVKSDGSVIYGTTDLATIYHRAKDINPDHILYVVDSRQANHFLQVFRCAYANEFVRQDVTLEHIGFGTMNGKDGKPFKTRDGGTLQLAELINMVEKNASDKIIQNAQSKEEAIDIEATQETASIIGLATLKYADLSNYRMKDYVFDLDKFSSFEGKTGPYILYSTVRIKNILRRVGNDVDTSHPFLTPASDIERTLMLKLDQFAHTISLSARDRSPNILAEYVYDLATLVSSFYHTHHILNETDKARQASWLRLLTLTLNVLTTGLDLLGIVVPERM